MTYAGHPSLTQQEREEFEEIVRRFMLELVGIDGRRQLAEPATP